MFFLLVKKDLVDPGQLTGTLHLITEVLPRQLPASTVEDVRVYVRATCDDLLECATSKDSQNSCPHQSRITL